MRLVNVITDTRDTIIAVSGRRATRSLVVINTSGLRADGDSGFHHGPAKWWYWTNESIDMMAIYYIRTRVLRWMSSSGSYYRLLSSYWTDKRKKMKDHRKSYFIPWEVITSCKIWYDILLMAAPSWWWRLSTGTRWLVQKVYWSNSTCDIFIESQHSRT